MSIFCRNKKIKIKNVKRGKDDELRLDGDVIQGTKRSPKRELDELEMKEKEFVIIVILGGLMMGW